MDVQPLNASSRASSRIHQRSPAAKALFYFAQLSPSLSTFTRILTDLTPKLANISTTIHHHTVPSAYPEECPSLSPLFSDSKPPRGSRESLSNTFVGRQDGVPRNTALTSPRELSPFSLHLASHLRSAPQSILFLCATD